MTTEPKASLGGDEPKANAPVAWRYRYLYDGGTRPGHWKLTSVEWRSQPGDHERAAIEAEPLYAAPVLPVEVREALADMILLAEVASAMIGDRDLFKSTERRITKARAILSTITGDA